MDIDKTNLEWLILADSAQIADGKLYLMGGGWDTFAAPAFPVGKHFGVALSLQVPWMSTNQRHQLEIEVVDEDAQPLAKMAGQVEVGRPAGIPAGQAQRAQFALELYLQFPKAGTYVVLVKVAGEERGRVSFNIVSLPGFPQMRPQP